MSIYHVPEIKALVESGDVVLSDYRDKYLAKYGQASTVSDDKLIELIAVIEEDDCMQDEVVTAMHTP